MEERPGAFWIAIGAVMLWVVMSERERPWPARITKAAISGGLGYSLSAPIAYWTERPEVAVAVFVTALGPLLLDALAAMLRNPKFLEDIVRKRLGGDDKG